MRLGANNYAYLLGFSKKFSETQLVTRCVIRISAGTSVSAYATVRQTCRHGFAWHIVMVCGFYGVECLYGCLWCAFCIPHPSLSTLIPSIPILSPHFRPKLPSFAKMKNSENIQHLYGTSPPTFLLFSFLFPSN